MKKLKLLILKNFNRKYYIFLSSFIAYFKSPKLSYSQYGEDLIIHEYFKSKNIHDNGVYIDIGCYHPKWISNTYILSKNNWRGYVIDIDESKLRMFKLFRKNCLTICAAISPGRSNQQIDVYNFKKLFSEIDTIDKNNALLNKVKFNCDFETNKVNTLNINDILKLTLENYGRCDFINLDIEGLDEFVLMELNFELYRPLLICFEKNNTSYIFNDKIYNFLSSNNYMHLFSSNGSHAFVLNN
jgi:hypothetical protein